MNRRLSIRTALVLAAVCAAWPVAAQQGVTDTEIVLGEASFANQPPLLCITITDQGEGIKKENIKRIFDPYFTTKVQTGTGLGLAIVSRLVQTNNGLVHFKTNPGHGTEVSVYFPLKT